MSNPKIKKHFSLFMVKKTIKKTKSEVIPPLVNPLKEIKEEIPKQLDPVIFFRIYGDIIFCDKPYKFCNEDHQIGVLTPYNNYKRIKEMYFCPELSLYTIISDDIKDDLDSIDFLCHRLMSLGDSEAKILSDDLFEYSKYIPKNQNLVKKIEKNINKRNEINILQISKIYKEYINHYFVGFHYQFCGKLNGLISLEHKISNKLVEFVFQNENKFYDHMIDNGLFDFLNIRKNDYFRYLHNIMETIFNQKHDTVLTIIKTIDDFETKTKPENKIHYIFDEKGEIIELLLIYIFNDKDFTFIELEKKRHKNNKINSKKKNVREENLDQILNIYYSNKIIEEKKKSEEEPEDQTIFSRRCQYRNI